MTAETSRKIGTEAIEALRHIQEDLRRRGMSLSQKALLENMIRFVRARESELLGFIQSKKKSEPLDTFLRPVRGKGSDSVREHNLLR